MDVRIEAAPLEASAVMLDGSVGGPVVERELVISLIERVASFSCPSLGSHSLSAVAPDSFFERTLANAA